jgi:hypothetical protein
MYIGAEALISGILYNPTLTTGFLRELMYGPIYIY